jgi:hypothetical protein
MKFLLFNTEFLEKQRATEASSDSLWLCASVTLCSNKRLRPMKKLVVYNFVCLLLCSCVKNRQCECKNANNTYNAGATENTKRAAKKHCESLSTSETTCYLK